MKTLCMVLEDLWQFLTGLIGAYAGWANDVRSGAYPEDKHGFYMDEAELEKFYDEIEKF